MEGIKQTQENYNRLSRWYDWLSGPSERKYVFSAIDLLNPLPEERILEVGFGTGHALVEFAERLKNTSCIYGIDLSLGMASVASARLLQHTGRAKVCLVCGDGCQLPFPTDSFDVLFLSFTLELFVDTDIWRVLAEARRVLAPGGRIGVVSLSKPISKHRGVTIYEWFHQRFPGVIDCRPIPLQETLIRSGFMVDEQEAPSLMGFLPLEIVVARNPA